MVILRILASFSHYTTPMESRSKFTQVLTDSYNINEEITRYPVSLLSSLFPNLFLTSIFLQKSFLGAFWLQGLSLFHRCIDGSNCPDGNFKVIRKCTIYSPTLCSGCDEGNYFDNSTGLDGGCVECSKCAIDEVETQKCSTAHDRKCEKKPSTTSKIWAPSKYN